MFSIECIEKNLINLSTVKIKRRITPNIKIEFSIEIIRLIS